MTNVTKTLPEKGQITQNIQCYPKGRQATKRPEERYGTKPLLATPFRYFGFIYCIVT